MSNYKEQLQQNNSELNAILETVNNLPEAGGGGGGNIVAVKQKDVNFYDYDGTRLYSYTVEEAQALTELPPLPSQPGLICQEWNYDLATIKSYNRAVDVGATYITDDGKTRLYIRIAAEGRMTVPLYFSQTVANGVMIDWGDGSPTEILPGTGEKNTNHTYESIGDYIISLEVLNGSTLELGATDPLFSTMGGNVVYLNMLQKVEIGTGVPRMGVGAFQDCYSLTSITIPDSVTSIGDTAFANCVGLINVIIPNRVTSISDDTFQRCCSLINIIIPDSVTSIGDGAFKECTGLKGIAIPDSVTSIGGYAFEACPALQTIVLSNSLTSIGYYMFYTCGAISAITIPDSVTSIGSSAFSGCTGLASIEIPDSVTSIGRSAFQACLGMFLYDFSNCTSIPSLDTSVFANIPSDCRIKVPTSLLDLWKSATNWAMYSRHITDNLDNISNSIMFSIDGSSYLADSGMTWAEWVGSDYNVSGYYMDNNTVALKTKSPMPEYVRLENNLILGDDLIIANTNYSQY